MIATEHFVYLHLHKSGGTFINTALLNFFPGAQVLGYHLPRRMIPSQLRGLPIIGFVRSPWSYYVSWYSFQRGLPQPNPLFRVMSEDGRLDFKQTITNMLELGQPGSKLEQLQAVLPEDYGDSGLNLPRHAIAEIAGTGLGFYSFLYRHMYFGEGGALYIGRTETLREDLLGFFERMGLALPHGFADYVREQARRNTSSHGAVQSYYDAGLRQLVEQRDAGVIHAFNYRFEDAL